jgi:hypothetical protein
MGSRTELVSLMLGATVLPLQVGGRLNTVFNLRVAKLYNICLFILWIFGHYELLPLTLFSLKK